MHCRYGQWGYFCLWDEIVYLVGTLWAMYTGIAEAKGMVLTAATQVSLLSIYLVCVRVSTRRHNMQHLWIFYSLQSQNVLSSCFKRQLYHVFKTVIQFVIHWVQETYVYYQCCWITFPWLCVLYKKNDLLCLCYLI